MMIYLKSKNPGAKKMISAIKRWMAGTRFDLKVFPVSWLKDGALRRYPGGGITLLDIRTKVAGHYYGNRTESNHLPSMGRGWGKKLGVKRMKFLSGADWIEFNDILNDLFDHLKIEAFISSGACVIRRGFKRRVIYREDPKHPGIWDKTGKGSFLDVTGLPVIPFSFWVGNPAGSYRMTYCNGPLRL